MNDIILTPFAQIILILMFVMCLLLCGALAAVSRRSQGALTNALQYPSCQDAIVEALKEERTRLNDKHRQDKLELIDGLLANLTACGDMRLHERANHITQQLKQRREVLLEKA